MFDLVKLQGLQDRYPRQLIRRTTAARGTGAAIVADPQLLLMTSPLAALDKKLREHMQLELKNIQRRLGLTVVYVTHDQTEALVSVGSDRRDAHGDGLNNLARRARYTTDRTAASSPSSLVNRISWRRLSTRSTARRVRSNAAAWAISTAHARPGLRWDRR